jgi:hypothetical protein
MKLSYFIAIIVTMLVGARGAWGTVLGGPHRLTVKGGEVELRESPVVAEIDAPLAVGSYVLRPAAGAAAIPVQVFEERGRRFLAVILARVAPGRDSTFTFEAGSPSDVQSSRGVSFERQGRNLRVELDHRLLTEYRVDVGSKPFFFPLIGPTGESFTRAYPMATVAGEDQDHPHQRSCWLTYGNVNGIDFWSESASAGTIKETERALIVEGPVLARLWTRNDWIAPDGKKICADERSVTFYRTAQVRIIDFDITIGADSGPVTFRDTKEGMFGLRVASSMDVTKKTGGKITNAEGLTDEGAWGQASPWVDYVGPVSAKTVGIAVLNHPESFRYPTTWHVRPYGLFAANPFGWHDFHKPERGDYTIAPKDSIRCRYRVILHEGATSGAGLPAHFLGYSKPPRLVLAAD